MKSEKGQIFILAVIVLTLVMINTVVLFSGSLSFSQNSKYSLNSITATNLAEAGVDKAVAALNKSGGTYNGESETVLGAGSFSVAITAKDAATKIIQATGYIPNKTNPKIQKIIKLEVSKGVGVAFNYGAQIGDGGLDMSNNSQVNGSVYSNGNIAMNNNAKITGDAYVAGGTQPTADQQSDCTPPNCLDFIFGKTVGSNNQLDVAQSFQPSCINPPTCVAVINKVSLKLKKIGSPSNITVRILGDNAGKPNKNSVLASGTLSASLVTTQYGFVDVAFGSPPTLTANTPYWIVLDTSANSSNYWAWSEDSLQGYTGGSPAWSPDWQAKTPVWNNIAGDLGFKTWMGGAATSIVGANGVTIGGNAYANTLQNLTITGGAYYQTSSGITAGSLHPNSPDPQTQVMPISQANIDDWKAQAVQVGVHNGDITNCPSSLAAGKYVGSISLPSNCTMTVNSPIWVTGDFTFGGNCTVKLSSTYGVSSGVLMVDNFVVLNNGNGNTIQGSGTTGSYLVIISNYNSRDDPAHNFAINIGNNGNKGILYSNLGSIFIGNNNSLTEVAAWKLHLDNNVVINYDQGLAGAFFSAGPSGAFSVIKGTYQSK